ncbi:MAG TPA: hypothetical protein VF773_03445 [Verrucomicrobiae bacterium]
MKLNVIPTKFRTTSEAGKHATESWAQLNELKSNIARQLTFRYGNDLNEDSVRFAVNEADAFAATLPYPLLLFPTLAEEKVLKASQWAEKQRQISIFGWREAA